MVTGFSFSSIFTAGGMAKLGQIIVGDLTMAGDNVVIMDKGRIVEEGDHATLIARGGMYARLWAHQSGGFLGETDEDEAAPYTTSAAHATQRA